MRLATKQEAMRVLLHDDIYEHIADGPLPDDFELPDDWIFITESGDELFCLEPDGVIHANVLKNRRADAIDLGKKATQWFFQNTELECIIGEIPEKYANVVEYAKKCCYVVEYINGIAYAKAERKTWALLEN